MGKDRKENGMKDGRMEGRNVGMIKERKGKEQHQGKGRREGRKMRN